MLKKIKTISNNLLAAGAVVAVLIVILIGLDFYQKLQQKQGLAENELLKVPKERIINYEVKPIKNPDIEKNSESIVVYRYVSDKEVPAETYQGLEEDISKRTPNSLTFLKSINPIDEKTQEEEYVAKFYTAPTFQKDGDKWYQVETATTTPSAFFSQTKLTLLDQVKEFFGQKALADTFYSGAGDGYVEKNNSSDWTVTHNAAVSNGSDAVGTTAFVYVEDDGAKKDIIRAFLPFDTSAIPGSATISSATLSIYVVLISDVDNDGYDYINVIQTTQASSATLTTADFNEAGATTTPTTGATAIDLTNISVSPPYTTFTLNATGLTWIAKSGDTSSCGTTAGVTCLGLREGHDMENNEIAPNSSNIMQFSTSEDTTGGGGTDQDPYLTVTYSVASSLRINSGNIRINGGNVRVDSSN